MVPLLPLLGVLIGIVVSIVTTIRLLKWQKPGSKLAVLSRNTTMSKTPLQTLFSDANNNSGIYMFANGAARATVQTLTDDGTYVTATLTGGMSACYRQDDFEAYCVPDVLGNTCMPCNDIVDPPNSGCMASDTSCLNNYANALAGQSKGPIRTGLQRVTDFFGEWVKIFRHDSSNKDFFSSDDSWAEAKQTNTSDPDGFKYSILSSWGEFLRNDKYTLKLDYPNNGITQIWSQTSNPVDSDGSGGVNGYLEIDVDSRGRQWGGLERRDYNEDGIMGKANLSSFLDGSISQTWHYAVGASAAWGGHNNYPGPGIAVKLVELWILDKPA